jgi:hypothetical protein
VGCSNNVYRSVGILDSKTNLLCPQVEADILVCEDYLNTTAPSEVLAGTGQFLSVEN